MYLCESHSGVAKGGLAGMYTTVQFQVEYVMSTEIRSTYIRTLIEKSNTLLKQPGLFMLL